MAIAGSEWIWTEQYEHLNLDLIARMKHRYTIESIEASLMNTVETKVPFRNMLVFNNGTQYVGIDKKKGPELIPKLIHQVWLGGKLPQSKKYFMDKIQKMHPDYKLILWTEDNITCDNFPVACDILKTLLAYQKSGKSRYKKYASMVDIMRH